MPTPFSHQMRRPLPKMSSTWNLRSSKIHSTLVRTSRLLHQYRPNTQSTHAGSPSLHPRSTLTSRLQNLSRVRLHFNLPSFADNCRGSFEINTDCDTADTSASRCSIEERSSHTSTSCSRTGKATNAADTPNSIEFKCCTNHLRCRPPIVRQKCKSRALDRT